MPKLRLLSLVCHVPQDSLQEAIEDMDLTSYDETYMSVNGRRVWGVKRMDAGDEEDLSEVPPINFRTRVRVDLYDKDAGYFSDDDHLGSLNVRDVQAGKGEQVHEFTGSGAHYTLKYEVA